jgi:hypothetical protein
MLRRGLALGPVVALALACASPTLPLPPPLQPTISPVSGQTDYVKLTAPCSGAEGGATIVIENTDTSLPDDERIGGSIASSCGSWDATVYARSGDALNITQQVGTEVSSPEVVTIP